MAINLKRHFTVQGRLSCLFAVEAKTHSDQIAGLEVQLWQKSPLNITFLGNGFTDDGGIFTVAFHLDSPSPTIVDGQINNVFLKVIYNNNVVLSGDTDPVAGSFE